MKALWEWIKNGYVMLIQPVADLLVRWDVDPNIITTVGTLCTLTGAVFYALGHIRTAGAIIALTALFDILDGTVARRTGKSTVFGAFYDSTLDRVADGGVLAGLAVFYASSPVHRSVPMLTVTLLGMIGTFLISYTRARAEALGIDAKVGVMQRPERVVLLSVPQMFFGLALDGWVLAAIVVLLTVTAWMTAVRRVRFVHRATHAAAALDAAPIRDISTLQEPTRVEPTLAAARRVQS